MQLTDWLRQFVRETPFKMVEPRAGYWTDNPAWGRNIVTRLPTASGVSMPVAGSDSFPGPPSLHTVQLFRGDARSANNADVYAKVSYGVGGTNNSFMLDWAAGAQFSLVANSIRVDAVSFTPDGRSPYNPGVNPAELVLGVTFGRGAQAHGPPLTLSESVQRINTGGNVIDFPIPDFARAVLVRIENGNNSAADPAPLTNWNPTDRTFVNVVPNPGLGGGINVDAALWGGSCGAVGLPIFGGASFLRVQNNSQNAPVGNKWKDGNVDVSVQWVLSL